MRTEEALEKIIELLKRENKELREENARLKKRIIALEDKLNINSGNSGLPTSKEVYKIEKFKRVGSGKKAGGQPGHKLNDYKMKAADVCVDVSPQETQCVCGGELIEEEKFHICQKVEIPVIKPIVTEYRLKRKICALCKKRYKGKLDNYQLLGKNAEAVIGSLGGYFNNSKRDIQLILSQIFNLDISLGLLSKSELRISGKLQGKYGELVSQAEDSRYLHLDESGHNNKGKRGWCWVAANKEITVFKLTQSRGKKALESFLPEYEGKVITDRYCVYNIFAEEKRQICLAHLRRDFKRFAHSKNVHLSNVGVNLVRIINIIFALYKLYKSGRIEKYYYLRQIRKLKAQMLYYLKLTYSVPDAEQAYRVSKNILKYFDLMWRFVDDESIEPTNNFAERQIKHHVKYRKNSLFTWSERGDRFLERIKSIYCSAKLQNINPFTQLQILIQNP